MKQGKNARRYALGMAVCALSIYGAGCGSSETTAASGAASTLSISGSMTISSASASVMSRDVKALMSAGVDMLATACTDGYYYRVGCMGFADTLVAKEADVTCSGSTGSFTVTDMPVNTPIGCILYRGATQSSSDLRYFAAIEVPTKGLAGTTDTMVSSGDLTMALTVNTNGTVSATVTGSLADNTAIAGVGIPNGFYKMECGSATGSELDIKLKGRCRCFLRNSDADLRVYCNETGGEVWETGHCQSGTNGVNIWARCYADNGSKLLALETSPMYVEANIFSGTTLAAQVLGPDGTPETPAGTPIKGISVWGASCTGTTCTSLCGTNSTCGEGFPSQMASIINFTSENAARVHAGVNWHTGGDLTAGGYTMTSVPALPAKTGSSGTLWTVGDWQTWLQSVINATNLGSWSCTNMNSVTYNQASKAAMTGDCVGRFVWEVYKNFSQSSNLPRIRNIDYKCYWDPTLNSGAGGQTCLTGANEYRLQIEGIDFNYNWDTWTGSQAAVLERGGMGPMMAPDSRMVFETWQDYPNGGGTFSASKWREEKGQCTSEHYTGCAAAGSTTANTWLSCGINELMTMKFIPTATSGVYRMLMNQSLSVNYAYMNTNGNGTNTVADYATAKAACEARFSITSAGDTTAEASMTWLAAPVR